MVVDAVAGRRAPTILHAFFEGRIGICGDDIGSVALATIDVEGLREMWLAPCSLT